MGDESGTDLEVEAEWGHSRNMVSSRTRQHTKLSKSTARSGSEYRVIMSSYSFLLSLKPGPEEWTKVREVQPSPRGQGGGLGLGE